MKDGTRHAIHCTQEITSTITRWMIHGLTWLLCWNTLLTVFQSVRVDKTKDRKGRKAQNTRCIKMKVREKRKTEKHNFIGQHLGSVAQTSSMYNVEKCNNHNKYYVSFLRQSKDMHLGDRQIYNSKLSLMWIWMWLSLYVSPAMSWRLVVGILHLWPELYPKH